jgi:plasmid maintenance system killer protein
MVFLPALPYRPAAVRVTANYRNTFGWSGEDALDVDFEDYH